MTKLEFNEMDNVALESNARNLHGALYHRINTLQRDLNIARETIKRQRAEIEVGITLYTKQQTQKQISDIFYQVMQNFMKEGK